MPAPRRYDRIAAEARRMIIETVQIADLKPDPRNARKHSKANVAKLRRSFKRFGQQRPILVTARNVVVAGHGFLEAMKAEGAKTVGVIRTRLKGSELKAYGVADNALAEDSQWNRSTLAELLGELQAEDETILDAIGYTAADVDALVAQVSSPSPGVVPRKTRSEHRCPACGHNWTGSSHPPRDLETA